MSSWVALWIVLTCTVDIIGVISWMVKSNPLFSAFSCGLILMSASAKGILGPGMYLMEKS